MSMISGQIDRLHTAAKTYRRLGNHSAENMLLDAADTIWQLRDDLQRAHRENAELRELVKSLYRFSFDEYPDGTELNFADKLYMLGIEVDDA